MKILLTNHFIHQFTGSEINVIQIAKELIKKKHEVYIFTFKYDNPLKEYIKENISGLKILNENEVKKLENVDLVWAHHATTLEYILRKTNLVAKKIIFSSLSPFVDIERPPIYTKDLTMCIANSKENMDSILKNTKDLNKIYLMNNFITDEFLINLDFDEESLINIKQPSRICVVSNHVPEEVFKACNIFEHYKVKVDLYGIGNTVKMITADVLREYDAVITIGKTVQYALAMGIPVYCYDIYGGPGWIMEYNFYKAQEYNFSGRCVGRKIRLDEIITEILLSYKDALISTNKYLCDVIRSNNLLSDNLDEILSILDEMDDIDINYIRKKYNI